MRTKPSSLGLPRTLRLPALIRRGARFALHRRARFVAPAAKDACSLRGRTRKAQGLEKRNSAVWICLPRTLRLPALIRSDPCTVAQTVPTGGERSICHIPRKVHGPRVRRSTHEKRSQARSGRTGRRGRRGCGCAAADSGAEHDVEDAAAARSPWAQRAHQVDAALLGVADASSSVQRSSDGAANGGWSLRNF